MASLLTESFCNKIKTEGNLSLDSNLKQTIQTYLNGKIVNYLKTKVTKYNHDFKEIKTDLICSIVNSEYNTTLLDKRGYQVTSENEYSTAFFNNIESYKKVSSISKVNIKSAVKIECESLEKDLTYFTKDDIVCFFNEIETKIEYYFQLGDYKTIDFKLDKDDFVYMILEKNEKIYLAITHLAIDFAKLNKFEASLEKEKLISFIEINQKGILEDVQLNKVVISNNQGLTEITLSKKYYFFKENKIFFNYTEDLEEFQHKFIDNSIQINHLNMYNYLNFLGLNNFKIDGKRKISSFESELFNNIFKNKFDNTLNGGLNYFNSKKRNVLDKEHKKPDYLLNIEDEYFSINGNFNYNFESGNFLIEVDQYNCKLFKLNDKEKLYIKSIKIPSNVFTFYFCNLKFNLKKFELPNFKLSYKISSNSPYTFKIIKKDNIELKKIHNNSKSNEKKMIKVNTNTNGVNNNVWFSGKSLIFENIYDFENKRFIYNNVDFKVKRNESIDISKYKKYFSTGSFYEKENSLIFKSDSSISLTTTEFIKYELVTDKGYITDFWFNNQGKTLYFKNTKGNVKIIENIYEADYSVHIPLLDNFIEKLEPYSQILDVNDEIIKLKNSKDILITDKIFDKPLYNKAFLYNVKDLKTFRLFNSDNIEEFQYISNVKNNILEIYFNAEPNKKYYCSYDDEEFIYLNIEKAQDDFKIQISFDENGERKIEKTNISKISLEYNKVLKESEYINIFFYDFQNKETIKVNFNNLDLGKEFELNINCDFIVAEANFDVNFKNLNINIVNLKSFVENNYIYFIKDYYADLIYISEITIPFDNKYLRKKLKVNTKYKIKDGILKEDVKGNILISSPQRNNIYIKALNKTSVSITDTMIFSIEKDEFYEKNFKTPGIIISNNSVTKETRIEKLNSNILIGGQNELL